ncbi:G-protein coupled receptor 4-like [Erpetoichthys calabaricus]|uniref:G-protein coupled receptor 4-like n=1 Tax=Erpetoichthys calabaricus TaxID=27687 RepID=UPI002234B69B|nr:G-protein coupled receptor 4-like [Erpetoichthys calabaricus]XP_051781211.1 G-protein coupled receptor 4-like [Erpetoichthys calabaricus]
MMNNTTCYINFSYNRILLPSLYSSLLCFGLPSNSLALYGLYRLVKAENLLPIYVMNLLLSDLFQMCTMPFWIDYYWKERKWHFGETACLIVGFIFYVSLFVSVGFLCCIALERYLATVHPIWFHSHHRLRYACALCASIWVAFVLLFLAVNTTRGNESDLCFEHYPITKEHAIFRLTTMTMGFPLPFLLQLFLYIGIRRSLHFATSVPLNDKKRINRLLSLVLALFVLFFGPYHVISYVRYVYVVLQEDSCDFETKLDIYLQVARGLLSLNCLLDPIMYIFVCRNAQKEILAAFPFLKKPFTLLGFQKQFQESHTHNDFAINSVAGSVTRL